MTDFVKMTFAAALGAMVFGLVANQARKGALGNIGKSFFAESINGLNQI